MAKKKTTAKARPRTTTGRKQSTARTAAAKKKAVAKKATTKTATTKKVSAKTTARSNGDKAARGGGVLDAAVTVLKAASPKPMNCREMMEAIMKRRLWTTTGKTPAATLSSAILREVQRKGKEARFEKVGRGQFRLRKGA